MAGHTKKFENKYIFYYIGATYLAILLVQWIPVSTILFIPGILALGFILWQGLRITPLFKIGSLRYSVLGFCIPLFVALFVTGFSTLLSIKSYRLPKAFLEFAQANSLPKVMIFVIVMFLVLFLYLLFTALAQEIGWRGYLLKNCTGILPKALQQNYLSSLFSRALFVGLIWGLWNLFLLAWGLFLQLPRFSSPEMPLLTLSLSCANYVLLSIIFTWLFDKQQSIWPTTLALTSHDVFILVLIPAVSKNPFLGVEELLLVACGYAIVATLIVVFGQPTPKHDVPHRLI